MNSDFGTQTEISSTAGPDSIPSKWTGEDGSTIPFPRLSPRRSVVSHPTSVHSDRAETRLCLSALSSLSPIYLPTSDSDSHGFCASPCSIRYFKNARACGQCLFPVLGQHVSPGGTGAPQLCAGPQVLPHQALPCWDHTDLGDICHICLDEGRKTDQHCSGGTTFSFLPRRTDKSVPNFCMRITTCYDLAPMSQCLFVTVRAPSLLVLCWQPTPTSCCLTDDQVSAAIKMDLTVLYSKYQIYNWAQL